MAEPTTRLRTTEIGAALGRLPSGLFILTARRDGRASGMLASWVQQAGFEPPMVSVAIARGRYLLDWVAAPGGFVLNQVPSGNKSLLRHFGKGFAADQPAFQGVAIAREEPAGPVLAEAMSWLALEAEGSISGGDHVLVLARVVAAGINDPEARPSVHLRRDGLHY